MDKLSEDVLRLKATIEFGSEYTYSIKNGGLGRTLVVDAETKDMAGIARKKLPSKWEGLYILVIYSQAEPEDWLCDPDLS